MNDSMNGGHFEQRGSANSEQAKGAGWSVVLIFACVALGFCASAAEYERLAASNERIRAEVLATTCSTVEGQLEDVGKFLADPHTRIISMRPLPGMATASAVIAWNEAEQNGYFLCDELSALDSGSGYELWALHGTEKPVKVTTIHAKPGASVYPFRSWQAVPGKLRLELTAGPRSAAKNAIFAGDID